MNGAASYFVEFEGRQRSDACIDSWRRRTARDSFAAPSTSGGASFTVRTPKLKRDSYVLVPYSIIAESLSYRENEHSDESRRAAAGGVLLLLTVL